MIDLFKGLGAKYFAAAVFSIVIMNSSSVYGADSNDDKKCDDALTEAASPASDENAVAAESKTAATPKGKASKAKKTSVPSAASSAYARLLKERGEDAMEAWTLEDFFSENPDENIALAHPFTIANAAEKAYAMLNHVPAVKAKDPMYGLKDVMVYPVVTGHPLGGGRMVVGNEEAVDALVNFLGSLARGDRSGKAFGFPGPAGTGKTELLYVIDNVEKNLAKTEPQFKQFSYRWKNLNEIPILQHMFKFDRTTGKPISKWIDPDMPRSPFTLLRQDMKEELADSLIPKIRRKWGMTISKGWLKAEPKSRAIIRAILQHKYPEIAQGLMNENDLTREEYISAISEFMVIVPKSTVQNKVEPQIIRAQGEDPNFEALFARPNLMRQAFYSGGEMGDLAVDYSGQVFQQDGGLLMLDELYRNPESLLNILLEVKQNRMVQTDYGDPVEVDIVPIWNSNDEKTPEVQKY